MRELVIIATAGPDGEGLTLIRFTANQRDMATMLYGYVSGCSASNSYYLVIQDAVAALEGPRKLERVNNIIDQLWQES